ncbi:unnamed protein product [Zymoseptoria tritici ST99CH_3D7]|uniref:G domain-containing protein n=1 Tax=Zymoseptoria tritici (strain ST99CH_3D7) TaxID=1276538 RepID=A0A1X7RFK2_ZYMT9|nr:unnamed protein product [Zymoseptoria tritici ST99CH_3D7]
MLRISRLGKHVVTALDGVGGWQQKGWPRGLLTSRPSTWLRQHERSFSGVAGRLQEQEHHTEIQGETQRQPTEQIHIHETSNDTSAFARTLPVVCPGCGALSQTVVPDAAGYYTERRKREKSVRKKGEDAVFREAIARLEGQASAQVPPEQPEAETKPASPICDRCHDLIHQSKGQSIVHPSMQSIQAIIESSPHKHNHIYHVIDAADFPLSLIPNLMSALDLPRLRTQNRRSKSRTYTRGRVADVSFIITRSDLLAPKKEQVDRLMPYLQDVLRDALGRTGKNVRLGSLRCVSAKRGWWTPSVKKEIWDRGGAGWVVGKVNVGKSALYEVVFPKGSSEHVDVKALRSAEGRFGAVAEQEVRDAFLDATAGEAALAAESAKSDVQAYQPIQDEIEAEQVLVEEEVEENEKEEDEDELSLLPPAQPETQYPQMPTVSALPGTTASPIRIPYGKGRGELIDLPGVQRSSLETHIQPEHHASLVMKSRVTPEQHTLKPGQSLLLGGIIRITPKTDDLVFLAYPFTPLKPHVSSKAVAIQTGTNEDGTPYTGTIENIGTQTAKGRVKSAGTFKLEWDVTKPRAGPLTDKTAGKQRAENLPFMIYSADILIEGVGWVELACQVRKKRSLLPDSFDGIDTAVDVPEVEVFTPKGKFIGVRKPMNAWLLGGPKKVPKHLQRARPRMSMSMQRRKEGGRRGGPMSKNGGRSGPGPD